MTKFEEFLLFQKKINAFRLAFSTIGYDALTVAPKDGTEYRGEALSILSGEYYNLVNSPEYIELVKELKEDKNLSYEQKRMIDLAYRDLVQIIKVPKELYTYWTKLTNDSYQAWHDAKEKSNYAEFEPFLQKVLDNSKKIAEYCAESNADLYDYMLDVYEPGMSKKDYDEFFDMYKKEIIPLVKELNNNPKPNDAFLNLDYDLNKQREFTQEIMNYLGADKNRFYCGETEHPFSNQISMGDVRIATKYTLNNMIDNVFSVIHELGHGFFQAYIDPKYAFTPIENNISMGLHESQSRFLENYLARRKSFWVPLYPKLQKLFPEQLKDISLDEFVKAVNIAKPSLVRTEADELTYAIHVIIRYEIEKDLFSGKIKDVKTLNKVWNEKYAEYLGLTPGSDKEGVLQDVHWSDGSFGYFPTYALGSAFAAQFYQQLQSELDVDKLLEEGKFLTIKEWLIKNIYQNGILYPSKELVKKVTKEEFNPKYYIEHLKNKYAPNKK